MRKSKLTDEQMVRILRETDKASIADVAKKHGVSDQTIYIWKRTFGTIGVDDAKRLKSLEQENAKLKKLLAERMLDIEVLKDVNSKNGERARSSAAGGVRACALKLPLRRACTLFKLGRSTTAYARRGTSPTGRW